MDQVLDCFASFQMGYDVLPLVLYTLMLPTHQAMKIYTYLTKLFLFLFAGHLSPSTVSFSHEFLDTNAMEKTMQDDVV